MWNRYRADVIVVAALTVIILLFLWQYAFTPLILPRGDAFTYFYPYWQYKHEVLRTGQLPLWNPYLFMGAPFLANSQVGVLYPPNWLLTPLEAPYAVKATLIGHLIWAALGMYAFARRALNLLPMPALLSGIIFVLSGYLGAQVEHVNQLQGSAWLPWLFLLWNEIVNHKRTHWLALLAAAIGLQLLAGHTQSAFISGVGLGVYALWETLRRWFDGQRRTLLLPLGVLASSSLIALGLAAAQLLPTIELAGLSNRSGGLTALEAVSFSLNPLLLGRTLLTDYSPGPQLFPEYVAYFGMSVIFLSVMGAFAKRKRSAGMLVVTTTGLFLALGAFNPIYWFLVNLVPGFGLFRAPARWLLLVVLGIAGLAGIGLQRLATADQDKSLRTAGLTFVAIGAGLAALSILTPVEAESGIGVGEILTIDVVAWGAVAVLTLFVAHYSTLKAYRVSLLAILVTLELFLASHAQPYNRLSSPLAWTNSRQAIDVLQVAQAQDQPGARMLSISETFFDPGDLAEINVLYGTRLAEQQLEDYVIATKQKEILSPNLPLAWRVYSMDGFDGGVLPLQSYIDYTGQFLPSEVEATDGRLREYLPMAPPLEVMQQTNTRYLITDKVFDAWVDGVYHDLQFPQTESAFARPWESFTATGMSVIGIADGSSDIQTVAQGQIITVQGDTIDIQVAPSASFDPSNEVYQVEVISWGEPAEVEAVALQTTDGMTIRGITLVDERSNAFMPTVLTPAADWQVDLIHAADVKVYDVVSAQRRATVHCADAIRFVETLDASWQFLPAETVIVGDKPTDIDCASEHDVQVEVVDYQAESVALTVTGAGHGHYLIFSDADYPGWSVMVNDEPVPIELANGMFRAVPIPEGDSQIEMTYQSRPLQIGFVISGVMWLLTLSMLLYFSLRT